MEKTYEYYFIQAVDIPSVATKMESILLGYIRNYMEHSVLELNALLALKTSLENYQNNHLRPVNPRLKAVGIQLSEPQYKGLRWLTIGRMSVTCTRVKRLSNETELPNTEESLPRCGEWGQRPRDPQLLGASWCK